MMPAWERDHPRVCGEKTLLGTIQRSEPGSPPRMRGKVQEPVKIGFIWGITPAYAGKRGPSPGSHPPWRDHPRVCGEKYGLDRPTILEMGSPPRMRGKDLLRT